jgi:hypothetical protein
MNFNIALYHDRWELQKRLKEEGFQIESITGKYTTS